MEHPTTHNSLQCWVYMAVCALEAAICVKFGRTQLPSLKITFIVLWIIVLAVGTIACVWLSVTWAKYSSLTEDMKTDRGELRQCYLDSSTDNLSAMLVNAEAVRKRKRMRLKDN